MMKLVPFDDIKFVVDDKGVVIGVWKGTKYIPHQKIRQDLTVYEAYCKYKLQTQGKI